MPLSLGNWMTKKALGLNTDIFKAIKEGNVGVVTSLLDSGIDVNQPIPKKQDGVKFLNSPLYYAVLYRKSEIVNELLKRGADPNSENTIVQWRSAYLKPSVYNHITPLRAAVDCIYLGKKDYSSSENPFMVYDVISEKFQEARPTDNKCQTDYPEKMNIINALLEHGADPLKGFVKEYRFDSQDKIELYSNFHDFATPYMIASEELKEKMQMSPGFDSEKYTMLHNEWYTNELPKIQKAQHNNYEERKILGSQNYRGGYRKTRKVKKSKYKSKSRRFRG